eukprot:3823232-Pyramimonas_sp.AAC.1
MVRILRWIGSRNVKTLSNVVKDVPRNSVRRVRAIRVQGCVNGLGLQPAATVGRLPKGESTARPR